MTDRELIHQLVDKVLDVHEQTGHYATVEISSHGHNIRVRAMEGGWDMRKDFDLFEHFNREDSDRFPEILNYLDSLLKTDSNGGNRKESSN